MEENKYILQLKALIFSFLKDEKVKIILFGSRARGDNSPVADVDIGLLPEGELDPLKLALLQEAVEESTIPYKVEIVDLSRVSEDFRKAALKEAVVWKD